jgi:hypothetical protein
VTWFFSAEGSDLQDLVLSAKLIAEGSVSLAGAGGGGAAIVPLFRFLRPFLVWLSVT